MYCGLKELTKDRFSIFFFDFRGDDILFRLNQEGKCVLIALPVSKAEAMKSHWFKVKIAFNLKQDEITLRIHNQEKVCKGVLLSDEFSPKIVFGKSDHIIDVPEIAIDKVAVNADCTYTFPLDEADGESVCNREGILYGKVENPIWLINEACHWRKEGALRRHRKLVPATMPTETRFIISTVIRCSSTIWRREALLPRLLPNGAP